MQVFGLLGARDDSQVNGFFCLKAQIGVQVAVYQNELVDCMFPALRIPSVLKQKKS